MRYRYFFLGAAAAALGCGFFDEIERDGLTEDQREEFSEVAPSPPGNEQRSLLDFMRDTQANEVPITRSELVARSNLILSGRIASVAEGRVIDFARGPSNPTPMAVMNIDVERVMKGNPELLSVSFEYIRGGASIEQLNANIPGDSFIFFLTEATAWDNETYVSDDRRRGLKPGRTLFALTASSGMLMELGERVVPALNPSERSLFLGLSISSIAEELETAPDSAAPIPEPED